MGKERYIGREPGSNPLRLGKTYCIQGGGATSTVKGEKVFVNEDVCYTINTVDVHAVCYGIDRAITIAGGNCTAGGACIYKDKSPTLKAYGTHAVFMEEKENV